jgi:hypothetical protein
MTWVSRLFLTGFASTALFGTVGGRLCDSYGQKAGDGLGLSYPYLLTKTQLKSGKVSYHKSRVSSLACRICHDKLAGIGALFERLNI